MKKTFTFLLTVFLGATVLMAQIPHELEKVMEGDDVYWVLDTPEDLIWLADTTITLLDADNDGTDDFDSIYVKMSANYRLGDHIIFDEDPTLVDWNNDGITDAEDELGLYAIGGDGAPRFMGHFDGQYFKIENAYKYCVNSERQRVALFGSIEGATIENLYLKNYNFSNNEDYGGAIVARATYNGPGVVNTFNRIWIEGTYDHSARTSGSLHNGGIAGRTKRTVISECVAVIDAFTLVADGSPSRLGAIVGTMGDSTFIKNSYSVSTLAARERHGQILGYFEGAGTWSMVENCYAAGVVSAMDPPDSQVGSFAGDLTTLAAPVSCYWDSDIMATGVGAGDNKDAVTGLSTTLLAAESNLVGWDFTNVWKIGSVNEVDRPVLIWQDSIGVNTPVAVEELGSQQQVVAYPNPVSNYLTIENAPQNAEYKMFNMVGQVQESGIVRSNRMILNVESYKEGIYILKVGDSVSKILVK